MKVNDQKGITLVMLVITIMAIIILAGVAIYSGVESINNAKYMKFKTELKIMQKNVNQWYEELQPNEGEIFSVKVSQKFTEVGAQRATEDEQAKNALRAAGINEDSTTYSNYYLIQESQRNQLNINDVEQDILVNVINRSVVSYLGFEYKNKMYYTLEDEDGAYNVAYKGPAKTFKKVNSTLSGSKDISKMTSKNPVIPKGFKPVDEGDAIWKYSAYDSNAVEGWDKGLVIEDEDGNQFVWVPCTTETTTSEDELVTYKKYYDELPLSVYVTAHGAKDYPDSTNDTLPGDTNTYKVMPVNENEQIEKYGGFYVARFEAGIPTTTLTHSATENNVYDYIPVSKKGAKVWNWVDFTHSYVAANKMINNEEKYGKNKSGIITGTQWDTIMKWYQKHDIPVLISNQNWGTHQNVKYSISGLYFTYAGTGDITGLNNNMSSLTNWKDSTTEPEKFVSHTVDSGSINKNYYHGSGLNESSGYKNNIADMGGNFWEWSGECAADNEAAIIGRSGLAGFSSGNMSAAKRDSGGKTGTYYYVGFRTVMYIQEDKQEVLEPPEVTIDVQPYTVASEVFGIQATITTSEVGNNFVDYENSKYVINTSDTPLGTDPSSYTDGNLTGDVTTINAIKAAGTYYLHVLVVDSRGEAQEYISSTAVTVAGKKDFDYTGAVQNITLPAGKYKLEVWGAQGGSYSTTYVGGKGGYSRGEIILNRSANLYVYVGGQGTSVSTNSTRRSRRI